MYNEEQVRDAARAVKGAIDAGKDGIGVEDTAAAITLFTAVAGCADEFKSNPKAAALHLVSELSNLFGDEFAAEKDPDDGPILPPDPE